MAKTFADRVARFEEFAEKGWLVQGEWRGERDGHEIACAIGAMYNVESVDACPADDMPDWLKHLTVTLFDGLPSGENIEAQRAINAQVLRIGANVEAWARIEVRFKIACVKRAISAVEPVAKDKDYWPAVTRAAQQVCDALEGKDNLAAARAAAARAAAEAAGAAAWAAWAAAEAAWAAAYRDLHADLIAAMQAEPQSDALHAI